MTKIEAEPIELMPVSPIRISPARQHSAISELISELTYILKNDTLGAFY